MVGDLRIVRAGPDEETYNFMLEEMKSIGAPCWHERVETAETHRRVSIYEFGLTRGRIINQSLDGSRQ